MRIAAYVRVSTDEQADKGNSLAEQRERLSAYCVAMGWPKPTFFVDDGYSAKDLKRPAVQKLIGAVKESKFDVVLTSKLDRMSRKLLDMLNFVAMLESHKCSYVSASEGFDTSTAVGRMVLQLLAAFAEFERERTRERVKDNMVSLAKNTDKAITKACFGYFVEDGKYVIDEFEAEYVRLMFELAENGNGCRMIARELNRLGVTTKKNKPWDQTNVRRLMQNETIAGIRIYNKRENKDGKIVYRDKKDWMIKEGNHPAIIDPARHARINQIMKSRKSANKHADSETYLLSGLVKCAHCGQSMRGNTARYRRGAKSYDYFRYICSSYVNGYACKHHAVHRDDLESEILDYIKTVSRSELDDLSLSVAPAISDQDEVADIRAQIARAEKRMQKQIEAYEDDLISAADLKKARERVEAERQELLSKLEKAENRKGNVEDVKINIARLIDDVTSLDRLRAKDAIRKLIDRIDLENGELISITWKG